MMLMTAMRLALVGLALAGGVDAAFARERSPTTAVSAVVSGDKIQKVGFRALVQNLAIQNNLAGFVRNGRDGTVDVRLEGARRRIDRVIEAMRKGSKKSSRNNGVRQSAAEPTGLDTFTIHGWTSVSRDIATPYDLVFRLREDDRVISRKAAKKVWNAIALATLKGDDLAKFKARLESND